MKTTHQTEIDDIVFTSENEVVLDADGEPMFERVTCETGKFPALRLATVDGVSCDAE